MLSKETIAARKALEEYENKFVDIVKENEDFTFEIWREHAAYHPYNSSKHIKIYFNDTYTDNSSIENDIEVNKLLKKYKDIDTLWIHGYSSELTMSLSHLFKDLKNIKFLKTLRYFKRDEYRNIKTLEKLEKLELAMYDVNDIDFSELKNLTHCTILMNKHKSTKDQIKMSKQYIQELKNEDSKIKFTMHIE
jgi:quinol monooxygenase YgiN